MKTNSFLIVLVAFRVSANSNAADDDNSLVDFFLTELDDLRTIVAGNITKAHNNFTNFQSNITSYASGIVILGNIDIDTYGAELALKLDDLKATANSQDVDVSSCMNDEAIEQALTVYKSSLNNCVNEQVQEAEQLITSARYIVDISMTRVEKYDYELYRCIPNLLCFMEALYYLEQDKIIIPEDIEDRVDDTTEALNDIEEIMVPCQKNNVHNYATYVSGLFEDITSCVNRLINEAV